MAVGDIGIYSHNASPMLYCRDNVLSFVHAKIDTVAATPDTLARVDIQFEDTYTEASPLGMGQNPHHYNYYLAHCPDGVTMTESYNRVVYPQLYENTDLHVSGNNAWMKFEFVIRPGGDPEDILMTFEGAEDVELIEETGTLVVSSSIGTYVFNRPAALKIDEEGEVTELGWQPDWTLSVEGDTVRFINIGEYDEEEVLVLSLAEEPNPDPSPAHNGENHHWHTTFGGQGDEVSTDVTTDGDGNGIFVGYTNSMSSGADGFPIDFGVAQILQGELTGGYDAYIAKFHVPEYVNPTYPTGNNGDQRRWVTYYGGSGHDEARAVLAQGGHETGSVFVAGLAEQELVLDGTGYVQFYTGGADAFVAELRSSDGLLTWATYLGSESYDEATSLAMDGSGNLFVGGGTYGNGSANDCAVPADGGFPVCALSGAYNEDSNPSGGAFILRFDSDRDLTWGTFFGGNGYEAITCMDHDGTRLYVGGYTNSSSGFPVHSPDLPDTYTQSAYGGATDGFVAVFNASLAQSWATLYGGNREDRVLGITVDGDSPPNIYVAGNTSSDIGADPGDRCAVPPTGDFPLCDPGSGAYFEDELNLGYYPWYNGGDGFIARFSSGYELLWGTYFGGENNDDITDIDFFNPWGNSDWYEGLDSDYLIVCGNSYSLDVPVTHPTDPGAPLAYLPNPSSILMYREPTGNTVASDGFQQMFLTSGLPLYGTTFVEAGINNLEESMNAVHTSDGTQMYFAGSVVKSDPEVGGWGWEIFPHSDVPFWPHQYVDLTIAAGVDSYMARFGYTVGIMSHTSISEAPYTAQCLSAYPNPTTGEIAILAECEGLGIRHISVASLTGQVVLDMQVSSAHSSTPVVIDLSEFGAGMYLTTVQRSDGNLQSFKLIRHGH